MAEYSSAELEKFDNAVGAQEKTVAPEVDVTANITGESGGKTLEEANQGVESDVDRQPLNAAAVFEAGQ